MRMIKRSGLVLAILVTSGCTTILQGNDSKPFEEAMVSHDYLTAATHAQELADMDPETGEVDDLFWTLQAGAALRFDGQYKLSTSYFDAAEKVMREEDTENGLEKGAETVGSIAGNDAMLDYEQTYYDGVMANTYKAWNFLADGDMQNARVEFNRAEERQRIAAEYFADKIKEQKKELEEEAGESFSLVNSTLKSDLTQSALKNAGFEENQWKAYGGFVNPYTTYSNALFLMLNAKSKSDYQKAADLFNRVYKMTKSAAVKADYDLARSLARGKSKKALDKKVWVVFENGQSIVREERRVDLPIGIIPGADVQYAGIALPKLKSRGEAYPYITVNGVKTASLSNMDRIIGAEFDTEFPYILAREVTRTTLKTIVQKQLNDENELLGLAAGILQAATTGADLRSFSALPCEFETASLVAKSNQVTVKAGAFEMPVELDKSSKNHVIYVKAPTANAAPTIQVINL
ncbi:hypothetical protein NF212_10425 [Parasalinivibrio latis]|uniref:COG3014 family protein n=1 Tax=Parasalinivibrio latis TaxID=2952610 RepID=UPI0030DE6DB7